MVAFRGCALTENFLQVLRRPKVAVASTGDELVEPSDSSTLGKGQVKPSDVGDTLCLGLMPSVVELFASSVSLVSLFGFRLTNSLIDFVCSASICV